MTRWRTTAYAAWAIIGVLLLVVAASYALGRISSALAPFVLAFLFVFILQGPVAKLEARGVPRGWAVGFWFLAGFVVLTLLVVFIAPPIGRQLVEFANAVPKFLDEGRTLFEEWQAQFSELVLPQWLRQAAISVAESLSNVFVALSNAIARGILGAGGGLASLIFALFLGVVISFWTLKDLPKIREELKTLAGEKYEADLENMLATIGRIVGGYLRGQTIASVITGILAWIGLAILGVPFAVVIGVITFIFNYVPYIGPFVAGLLAATLGLFEGPLVALGAVAVVIGAQNLVDAVITPRVMSEQVDLHPTLVIFSLLVGGTLFGFWGMLFAIPVAATAKALFVYYYERRTSRQLTSEDGALFKAPLCEDDSVEPCVETEEDRSEADA